MYVSHYKATVYMIPQQKLWEWCLENAYEGLGITNDVTPQDLYTQKLLEFAEWAQVSEYKLQENGKWIKWKEDIDSNKYSVTVKTSAELFDFWIKNELKLK